jgi:hypothetical protein
MIKVFILIQQLSNLKQLHNQSELSGTSVNSVNSEEKLSTDHEKQRNKIFSDLHLINSIITNKLSDFRGFCKLFFDSDKDDIV